jgi:hypothetical protein
MLYQISPRSQGVSWIKSVFTSFSQILAEIEFALLYARVLTHIVRAARIPHCRDWQAVGSNARGLALADKCSGSASPRFSRQSRSKVASSSPMMIRASEPMKVQRFSLIFVNMLDFILYPRTDRLIHCRSIWCNLTHMVTNQYEKGEAFERKSGRPARC